MASSHFNDSPIRASFILAHLLRFNETKNYLTILFWPKIHFLTTTQLLWAFILYFKNLGFNESFEEKGRFSPNYDRL